MTTYSTDTFDRTNSTTNLGSTDGAGTADPLMWTQDAGTWGISSNQAYTSTGANPALVDVDVGQADLSLSITPTVVESGTSAGLIFRYTDTSNYWRCTYTGGGNFALFKVVVGTPTQIGSNVAGAVAGDAISVVLNGTSIKAYRNGVLQISTTDSHNSTATKHGLWIANTSVNDRLNNWSAASVFTTNQPLTVTHTQTPTVTKIATLARILTVTQAQAVILTRGTVHPVTLTATQVQV